MVAGIGVAPMTMPNEAPIFEVRATMADGSRLAIGPFMTVIAASEQANLLLGRPGTRRVETLRRAGGQVTVIGVVGWSAPAPRRDGDSGGSM
jgi:hypothetical protein